MKNLHTIVFLLSLVCVQTQYAVEPVLDSTCPDCGCPVCGDAQNAAASGFQHFCVNERKAAAKADEYLAKINAGRDSLEQAYKKIQAKQIYDGEFYSHVGDELHAQYRSLDGLSWYSPAVSEGDFPKYRKINAEEWLQFRDTVNGMVDAKHNFDEPVYMNLSPSRGSYFSGIAPEDIKEPDIRQEYEERLKKNSKLARERMIQLAVKRTLESSTKKIEEYLLLAYNREPRADKELVSLMEKHHFPEDLRVKILGKLNIPYKGFRHWESTDGLFATEARYISIDKEGEYVTLERTGSRRTTIALEDLRKEDQEYIKKIIKQRTAKE